MAVDTDRQEQKTSRQMAETDKSRRTSGRSRGKQADFDSTSKRTDHRRF